MKNNYLKYFLLVAIVAFIVPQIALAVWWNPLSWNWNVFSWFSAPNVVVPVTPVLKSKNKNDNQPQNTQNNKPSIAITSPIGGEVWRVGETHDITWQYSNVPGSDNFFITVTFEMHLGGPMGPDEVFNTVKVPVSAKSYSWKITQPIIQNQPSIGSTFFIRVDYSSPDHSHTSWGTWGWGLDAASKYFSIEP
jgi:hypothetical protein